MFWHYLHFMRAGRNFRVLCDGHRGDGAGEAGAQCRYRKLQCFMARDWKLRRRLQIAPAVSPAGPGGGGGVSTGVRLGVGIGIGLGRLQR
jgi:hypothetical protein